MGRDYIEDELSRQSVFRAEHALSIDYVPDDLPHRENELRFLAQSFKTLITNPGSTSPRILIEGPVGSGKTAVAKRFSEQITLAASRRNIHIHKVHVNCRVSKSTYLVYLRMLREFKSQFPRRGHSPEELLQMIVEILDSEDRYLLLILDELDYFIKQRGSDLLYDLTRFMDDRLNAPQRISIVGVGREIPLHDPTLLDSSTLSTLQRNMIRFEPYSSQQLYDILNARAKIAFQPGAVMDETLQLICDIASEHGDARYAIELLWRAGKQAERERSDRVVPDHVRLAKSDIHPEIRKEVITTLPLQLKLLLLAIARQLRETRNAYVTIGEVEDMYRSVCEEYGEEPRTHTQIWTWVQDLGAQDIIEAKRSSVGRRGQTTLIGLSEVPAEMLEECLLELIEKDG
ncbi:MAG: ORC1-type DNA replication protein [Candidatus Thorarchaeota archaeon]